MTAKSLALVLVAALSAVAGAQSWIRPYDAGLAAARGGKWAMAREAFQQAAALRPEDQATPTVLPGPATDRKVWREGKPYSPNFLAAYALYRQGLISGDPTESAKTLRDAAGEFESLIGKDQASPEAFFFLDVIYTKLGDATKRQAALDRMAKLGKSVNFKVDTEVVAPEELAALGAQTAGSPTAAPIPGIPGSGGATVTPGAPFGAGPTVTVNGNVVALPTKFALVIGQSTSHVSGGLISFAANDAQRVRDALITFAGYPADNVKMLQNATASTIMAAAADLASHAGEDSTVTIYFAGAGVNLAGKDYLAGVDTESASDAASMVAKTDLFAPFVKKGARVFAFFETNRPIDANGAYFGREPVSVGSVAQVQSTRPGDVIGATYREGKELGLFTNAFTQSLGNLRSNRIPIFEFTWQIFNSMRRGDSGLYGGGGSQVCTLPVLTNLASDSKF